MLNEKRKPENDNQSRIDKAVKLSSGLAVALEETKFNEEFVIAVSKLRDLIIENWANYLFSGCELPFYNYYYKKYYNDAYLSIKKSN